MRSSRTREVRAREYFDVPNARRRWFAGSSGIRAPTHDAYTGMNRCISPYSFTSWMTSRWYALSVQPKSFSGTPVTCEMIQLATFDGSTLTASSCRFLRQPLTTSYPSPIFSSKRGMSWGSFCMSPSRKTRISPRLLSIPACTAAVCPKFRRKLTTRTCGSLEGGELPKPRGAAVTASIVDIEDLVRGVDGLQHRDQLLVQRRDAVDLVENEHDHRKSRCDGGGMPSSRSHSGIV